MRLPKKYVTVVDTTTRHVTQGLVHAPVNLIELVHREPGLLSQPVMILVYPLCHTPSLLERSEHAVRNRRQCRLAVERRVWRPSHRA